MIDPSFPSPQEVLTSHLERLDARHKRLLADEAEARQQLESIRDAQRQVAESIHEFRKASIA